MMFDSPAKIWQEIERSESYLVSSMLEEASQLASSIVKKLIEIHNDDNHDDDDGYMDMLESSSMVFVQSLHQLNKSSQILDELKQLFTSLEFVPVQIILTGACCQMSSNNPAGVADFLREFLSKWRFVSGDQRLHYVLADAVTDVKDRFVLSVDEYVEVAELYVMKLFATTLNDNDRAISWVEKALLPDETRQGLLRRLNSLRSSRATEPLPKDDHEERDTTKGSAAKQQAVLRVSKRVEPCFWWFRTINLKFGDTRVVVSNGKVLAGCLVLLLYWVLRRRQISIKRILERQVLGAKKALSDLWQLAFSYQVNPLAGIQAPPVPTRR